MESSTIAIYSAQNGEFIRFVNCPIKFAQMQAQNFEIAVNIDEKSFEKISCSYFDFSTNQIIYFENPPGDFYKFNVDLKKWVFDELWAKQEHERKRNKLLIDSDWTDTLSAKQRLGDQLYNLWQEYRQKLRDITQQSEYPFIVNWPIPPKG